VSKDKETVVKASLPLPNALRLRKPEGRLGDLPGARATVPEQGSHPIKIKALETRIIRKAIDISQGRLLFMLDLRSSGTFGRGQGGDPQTRNRA